VPRDRIATETDAAYKRTAGGASESRGIPQVVAGLAEVWG